VVLPELELLRVAHNVTIVSEMLNSAKVSCIRLHSSHLRMGLRRGPSWTTVPMCIMPNLHQHACWHSGIVRKCWPGLKLH
jgi:hypothetical protein